MTGLEIEIFGDGAADQVSGGELRRLCAEALARSGVTDGHVAIEFVGEDRIRELNRRHRGLDQSTDVLSFAIDETGPPRGPRELGDIVICAARTRDIREAVVHGALHLTGMDHENDAGEMLALQKELLHSEDRP